MRRWNLDPFRAAVGRPTQLLGGLWAAGGLLLALWAAMGVREDGRPMLVLALGVVAAGIGFVLLLLRTRELRHGQYVALTLLGSVVISAALWWSGSAATGAPAILFVYIGVFAGVALGASAAPVLAVSAAMHAAVLWVRHPSGLGEWLVIWGATLVASVLVGAAVTDNLRITAQRERLLEDLRAADETKTAFLQALGHDFANPTSVIVGLARTVIAHDADLDPERRRDLLERIAANACRLHDDLDALLRLEELRAGPLEANLEEVSLDALIADAIARADVDPARVERDGTDGIVLAADAAKLEHALANLLSNAAKYGGDEGPIVVGARTVGGPAPKVRGWLGGRGARPQQASSRGRRERGLRGRAARGLRSGGDGSSDAWLVGPEGRRGPVTVISVSDHGPGVPPELRERIFEPLQRARPEDGLHGSGIGLAVVRAFARFHGGESWVEEAPGGGARFCISVPGAVDPEH